MSSRARVLLFGSRGQAGTELQRSFGGWAEIIACDRKRVDLADEKAVRRLIQETSPDVILNAAAYTAVDKAESEAEMAMAINADAPRAMAEEGARRNALLVHYSTDYVFDGAKEGAWTESDAPHPLNAYGTSKLAGEQAIRNSGGSHLIFRTSWVYGPHGSNFLFTMLRLGKERDQIRVVDDQTGAPTSSIAIADATRTIVQGALEGRFGDAKEWAGLYHMTCGDSVTWRGFAQAIFERAESLLEGRTPEAIPIPSSEYPTPARRPRNSVLNCEKLHSHFGVALPAWQTALNAVLQALAARQIPA